jgi:hypothetical protein
VNRSLATPLHVLLQPFDLMTKFRNPSLALHAIAPITQIAPEPPNLDAHLLAAVIGRRATPPTGTTGGTRRTRGT